MKSWIKKSKTIYEKGKRILCDYCPCEFGKCACKNYPTTVEWVNVPADYATLTDAKNAGKLYVILDGGTHLDSLSDSSSYIRGVNNPKLQSSFSANYVFDCIVGDFNNEDISFPDSQTMTFTMNMIDCIIQNIENKTGGIKIENACNCDIDNLTAGVSFISSWFIGDIEINASYSIISNITSPDAQGDGESGGNCTFSGHELTISGIITGDGSVNTISGTPGGSGGKVTLSSGCASPSLESIINISDVIFGNGANGTANIFDSPAGGGGGFGVGGAGGQPRDNSNRNGRNGGDTNLCGTWTFSNITFGNGGLGQNRVDGGITYTSGNGGKGGYSGDGGNSADGSLTEFKGYGGDGGDLTTNIAGLTAGLGGSGVLGDGADGSILPC
jgi:hypothetical protein